MEMHSDEMSKEIERFLHEANELQWQKNRDYHPDKVAFLEILKTAADTNITVEQDLWAKIRKQFAALRTFVIDGQLASESPHSRMIDIAVYMGMLEFWVKHRKRILNDAFKFVSIDMNCERYPSYPCSPQDHFHSTSDALESNLICDRCRLMFWLSRRVTKD
jgi:hypothetical protein